MLANRQHCTSRSSFVFSNFARPARCKTSVRRIVPDAVPDGIRPFEDPVGDLLLYLYQPRLRCKKVVAIAQNAKAFDSQFILIRAILLKWTPN